MTRSFPEAPVAAGISRRRIVAGGAALTALVPALAACGGDAQQSAPSAATQVKGTIRFSHLGDPKQAGFWSKAAGIFSQQHPQIQLTAEPTWSWDNAKYIAEAVGDSAADVVWTSENYVTPLFARGVVQEVDQYVAKDKSFKPGDYFESVLTAYKFRNKQAGWPVNWGAYVLYYNKTLFERSGRKVPDDSWTWDTFLDAAKALSRPSTDAAVTGQYGFETRWHENVFAPWIWNAGGEIFSADGTKAMLDKNETIEGLQYLVDLIHRHRVAIPPSEITTHRLGTNAFGITGKIGMVFNAIYFLPTYRQASDGLNGQDWDIAPIPKGKAGRTTTNPTAGVGLWKGSKSPEAAWTFMRWANSKETAELWVQENMDGMPVHKGAADLLLKDSRPPKSKQVFVDAFKYAKPAFTTPYGQRPMSVFKSAVAPVFNNGGNVRQAVTEAMVAVRTAMDEEVAADVKK
ncbi:MAG TPA: sugar ABC transporter substrate-binding protein [Chloroflexota bacterium]|nr:sugar ABC transporter substrate-binding protein [Chloroflexota bacterium]